MATKTKVNTGKIDLTLAKLVNTDFRELMYLLPRQYKSGRLVGLRVETANNYETLRTILDAVITNTCAEEAKELLHERQKLERELKDANKLKKSFENQLKANEAVVKTLRDERKELSKKWETQKETIDKLLNAFDYIKEQHPAVHKELEKQFKISAKPKKKTAKEAHEEQIKKQLEINWKNIDFGSGWTGQVYKNANGQVYYDNEVTYHRMRDGLL